MNTKQYLNQSCVVLGNDALTLYVTQSVGPRILNLQFRDGDNLLAELPGLTLDCPGVGKFHLYGGHRLWYAPEVPQLTYLPDDYPVDVKWLDDDITFTSPIEPATSIQKSMTIKVSDDAPMVVVNHTLSNHGSMPVEYSPWSITQLKMGGFAILPQPTDITDPAGLQPNRIITLWPYTDIRSPFIHFGNRFVFIDSTPQTGPLKIGYPNPRGWLAYYRDNTLFVKYAPYNPTASYFDQGSSSECYCGPDFLELETLAPQAFIHPGEAVTHQEIWHVFNDIVLTPDEDVVQQLVDHLNLDVSPGTNRSS